MRFSPLAVAVLGFLGPLSAETFLVLPFSNQTSNKTLDWIGESIAENVRETLSTEGALTISREKREEGYSRLSVRPYVLLTRATVIKIGETVDADQILYGQFELDRDERTPAGSRGTLRITAQFLDRRKLRRGPEFLAIGAFEDLAALQTHLSWQALQFVMPATSPSEEEFRKRRPPVRVDAIENYIRGLLTSNDEQKVRFLQQASKLDPKFSPPCYQLGRYYWDRDDYKSSSEWLGRVAPGDDHHREAAFMRGVSRYELNDFAGAQAAFESLAREVPLNEVYNNLGAAMIRRNPSQAADNFRRALEGDDNDPVYLFNLGLALWKLGEYEGAAKALRSSLERDPDDVEASQILRWAEKRIPAAAGDSKSDNFTRLKYEFELSAFLQLRSILEGGKK